VPPVERQRLGDVGKGARAGEAEPQVVVANQRHVFVEAARRLDRGATHERHGRAHDGVGAVKPGEVEARRDVVAAAIDHAVVGVDDPPGGADRGDRRVALEDLRLAGELVGQPEVVGVEEGQVRGGRLGQAAVARRGDARLGWRTTRA